MKESVEPIISLAKPLLRVYILLVSFFSYGISQDCKLQYVMEPPSSISCNPYTNKELKLKCVVQGRASLRSRVRMTWFHTNLSNITINVTQLATLTRIFRQRTVTQGNNWNLTSNLTLTELTYPAHAGKWFCQPTLDGNLVLPSNKLTIGQIALGNVCNAVQVTSTPRCAYFFATSSTANPVTSSTADPVTTTSSSTTDQSISNAQQTFTPISSNGVNLIPSHTESTTLYSLSFSISKSTLSSKRIPVASSSESPPIQASTSDSPWVYALTVIVVVFAMIILVLAILLVGFFIKNKHSKQVPSTINLSTCDLSTNSAYGTTSYIPKDIDEPTYSVIPPSNGEDCYIVPDDEPSASKMKLSVEKHSENEYFRQSEYLEVKP